MSVCFKHWVYQSFRLFYVIFVESTNGLGTDSPLTYFGCTHGYLFGYLGVCLFSRMWSYCIEGMYLLIILNIEFDVGSRDPRSTQHSSCRQSFVFFTGDARTLFGHDLQRNTEHTFLWFEFNCGRPMGRCFEKPLRRQRSYKVREFDESDCCVLGSHHNRSGLCMQVPGRNLSGWRSWKGDMINWTPLGRANNTGGNCRSNLWNLLSRSLLPSCQSEWGYCWILCLRNSYDFNFYRQQHWEVGPWSDIISHSISRRSWRYSNCILDMSFQTLWTLRSFYESYKRA